MSDIKNFFDAISAYKDSKPGTQVNAMYDGDVAIAVRTKGGWLVSRQTGAPGIYDEISVDFIDDGGRLLQLATVGRDEEEEHLYDPEDGYQQMHVYAWDGIEEDVKTIQYVTVDESSHWYV